MQAILLAGGRGTRMGALTDAVPKPLVSVGGEPLIHRPLRRLAEFGCDRVILATGYLAEQFAAVLGDGSQFGLDLVMSVEDEPLGTGGAMALAARGQVRLDEDVVVMNADLISEHDLSAHLAAHRSSGADVTIHVRQVDDPSPFGMVEFDDSGGVTSFVEKPEGGPAGAWVNAGTYMIRGEVLLGLEIGKNLSWERDVLPEFLASGASVHGYRENTYFRDVGSSDDITSAEIEGR